MSIFRIGRGDFFGIIIPGAFLLTNILFLYRAQIEALAGTEYFTLIRAEGSIVVPVLFILSYITGVFLRVIKPSHAETLGLVFWLPSCLWHSFRKVLPYADDKPQDGRKLAAVLKTRIRAHWEPFPYIDWFFDAYLKNTPNSFSGFYQNLLVSEFSGSRELMKGQTFINQCKIYIYENSASLREEVTYSEGLVRFLSGIFFALAVSLLSILFVRSDLMTLLWVYVALLIVFGMKLRHLRVKEVLIILNAFAFIVGNRKSPQQQ